MEQQALIDSLDTARFACPKCHQGKIIQISEYNIKKKKVNVKVKCRCGNTYGVILEKKSVSTQNTLLLGTFTSKGPKNCSGKVIIKRLNSKGLIIKTNIQQNILPGFKLFVEFVLDDAKQSIVKKDVIVTAKKGKYLSAEFTSNEHYDNLGPYLFFNKLYL
ncbi:hypothetical protein [Desulfobacula sp.]|uniref:hypothetical protein n=1 Tax=Desulfobacula sp. TaxID=2593537 RepID=UPI002613E9CD|nr:hypothetical protein [Desulfobacula sp.]